MSRRFDCEYCNLSFGQKCHLIRHIGKSCKKNSNALKGHKCSHCNKTFSRQDVLNHHVKNSCRPMKVKEKRSSNSAKLEEPPNKKQRCDLCKVNVSNLHTHLRSTEHKKKMSTKQTNELVQMVDSAFKSRIATYQILSKSSHLIPTAFMSDADVRRTAINLVTDKQAELSSAVKVNLELFATCILRTKTTSNNHEKEEEVEELKSFNTKNKVIQMMFNDMETEYDSFVGEISTKFDEFEQKSSGWALKKIEYLEVNINKFSPLKGSSDLELPTSISNKKACTNVKNDDNACIAPPKGSSYLELPPWIRNKKACINVKNDDNACFAWAVVSAIRPVEKNVDRCKSYQHYKEVLNLDGIVFPISLHQIRQFEHLNDISINVFEIDKKQIAGPIFHTKQKRDRHVNLLLIEDGEKSHFCWIKNLSRLISAQTTGNQHRIHICDGCLLHFYDAQKLSDHVERDCSQIKVYLPTRTILEFYNYKYKYGLQVPVIVYADFEALLRPISRTEPSNSSSYTLNYQLHEPYSFAYFIKCSYDDSLSKFITYRGENCAKTFLESLEKELVPFAKRMTEVMPMTTLTFAQQKMFDTVQFCHICNEPLKNDRVKDHCHLTGKYRGAAHEQCNLKYTINQIIPIVFHNLSKYDSHFIIRVLHNRKIKIIAQNKENFISFTSKNHGGLKVDLRFIDSYRFLASSLDKLSANLEKNQFHELETHCGLEHFELLKMKGVFPYQYMDNISRLEETSLPAQSDFYDELNKSHISNAQYKHAQNVWSTFKIKTLGEYSDLYIKTDVLLLADVFENFRKLCLNTYHLDPAHYYTVPGLSWDAMLLSTKIKMELLTDISMIKFISRGMRGGLSQCCRKHAVANNKYLKKDYDSNKPSNFIIYLDANNQYGWAMSQKIPLKNFRWLSKDEAENFDFKNIPADADTGYILEVDLDYPTHLHELHNDFCFCPENRVPEQSKGKTPKLLSDLHGKRNYAIHYVNLIQAVNAGLVLNKIHRVLSFSQNYWLKQYIDLNTSKRMQAKNAFEKDFFKLMNNSVFGKTMENVDKRVNVHLVNQWESEGKKLGARALISRLNFHSATIIDQDLVLIQMNRTSVKYDKPIYVGFTVLDLSKTLMYEFHYDYIVPKYGVKAKLLYTDTDSLIYNIETADFYEDIKPDLDERFDTSDFSSNNVYKLPLVNKKVVGMFKDECAGTIIKEFIGIRSKCYYISMDNSEEIKKIKGIKREVVKKEVQRENFFRSVNEIGSKQYRTMNVIRSSSHELYSQTLNKVALCNNDDKRFSIPGNSFETLAWGHHLIEKYNSFAFFICANL